MTQPRKPRSGDRLVEAPVKVRVFRTVKKRPDAATEEVAARGDQESPGHPQEAGDDPDMETIEVRKFVTEPARVRFHFDIGRNVHFQSASTGASVEIPCYVEEIDEAFAEAKEFVLNRLRPEVKELSKVLDYLVEQRVKKERELGGQRG